jgi:gag-polypeptide of LTR copia-type
MIQSPNQDPSSSPLNSATTHNTNSITMDSVISLNLPTAIKLNDSNFLIWKSQIVPLIQGHDLNQFLTSSPPETTTQNSNGEITINLYYLFWHRQDQLLLAWLRSSLTELVLAQVISSTTSKEFWIAIEDRYSFTSRAKLHDLKRQIQTASKGESSCSEYLLCLRQIADELSFIGSPLPDDDLVIAIINGLGSEYNSLVAALSTLHCHSSFSFSDLRGLLLNHEALLKNQQEQSNCVSCG